MSFEPVVWESFAWKSGAETYRFEVRDSGLIGSLSVSDGRKFALPLVVWEALFDAVKTNRKAKSRVDENMPPRYGARWSDSESDELNVKFKSGRSIDDLAREHGPLRANLREPDFGIGSKGAGLHDRSIIAGSTGRIERSLPMCSVG